MYSLYAKHKKTQGVEVARSLCISILEKNNGNVSKTAKYLSCSRKTVRRARDGPIENLSRAPITTSKKKTETYLENLILSERKITKYGRVRLSKHLNLKY